ncbi:hypothetical protein ACI1MP_37280 (plasmid) [Kitasatospora griseola]|uniref:ATP-dependent DNA ligase n=1 Tax=Kitasatospora griseola TaxID=2064 RepID=UPI003855A5D0
MSWALPEPMLAEPVSSPVLPAGWAAEPKWDGYRAGPLVGRGGRVVLRSRRGAEMAAEFPEIVRAAQEELGEGCALDGELVVWEAGRLAFERLQRRLASRGARVGQAAKEWPAHFVAFDLLHDGERDLTGWPFRRRRAALEELFAGLPTAGPLALCPSTTGPAPATEWLGVDRGRPGGPVFQAVGRAVSAWPSGVAEVPGPHDHGGGRRRGHRHPGGAGHGAARPLEPGRAAAPRRPHRHPEPPPWPATRPGG